MNIALGNSHSTKHKDISKLYSRPFPYHTKKHFPPTENSPKKTTNSMLHSYESKKLFPYIPNEVNASHSVLKKSNSYSLLKPNESYDGKSNTYVEKSEKRNQTLISSHSRSLSKSSCLVPYTNLEDTEKNKNNLIFQLIYTKLKEIKISKNFNSNNIIESFIDIFEYISHNVETKYNKIEDILKYFVEKINHPNLLNSHSSTTGSGIATHHDSKSDIQLDQLKKEIKLKDLQIQSYIDKINEYERSSREKEILLNTTNKKYHSIKAKFSATKEEAKSLKTENKDLKCELEFLREKELKMMEVMFLLQRRGISIDEVMRDKSEKTEKSEKTDKSISLEKDSYLESHQNYNDSNTNHNNINDISINTVYFPDKVHPPNNLFDDYRVHIPKLDFSKLSGYQSPRENNSDIVKININTGGCNINSNNNITNESKLCKNDIENAYNKIDRNHSRDKNYYINSNSNSNSNIPNNPKNLNKNKNKNNYFPVSNSVSLTNLHSVVNNDNDNSVNISKNYYAKTLQDKSITNDKGNKANTSGILESFEEFGDSKVKAMNNTSSINNLTNTSQMNMNNSINISRLKDSLKNFSLSNLSMNNKTKMKQFNLKK